MRHWSDAKRKALTALGMRLEPLFSNLSPVVHDLGFDSWCFAVLDHNPMEPPLLVKTTRADAFVRQYAQQGLYSQDPRLHHGLTSLQPLRWEPALFRAAPQLWQMMREVDVTQGMSQACHHVSGLVALLCLGRSHPVLEVDEFQSKADMVLSLTNQLTVATVERIANDETLGLTVAEVEKLLTRREITVLEKTAAGYTAGHIAAEMCLSERTVQFHISSAITKLHVPNKTAAVAQAILLELIEWPVTGLGR